METIFEISIKKNLVRVADYLFGRDGNQWVGYKNRVETLRFSIEENSEQMQFDIAIYFAEKFLLDDINEACSFEINLKAAEDSKLFDTNIYISVPEKVDGSFSVNLAADDYPSKMIFGYDGVSCQKTALSHYLKLYRFEIEKITF